MIVWLLQKRRAGRWHTRTLQFPSFRVRGLMFFESAVVHRGCRNPALQ